MFRRIFLVLFVVILIDGLIAAEAKLINYPDINGGLIVFTYCGDIWTVSASGGEAKRLTSHSGLELFPKISPDGKWIAFSAEYSGSRQIHVMPANGGSSKQLTFYNDVGLMPPRGGFDYVVLGWTNDSKKVFFRANRTPFDDRLGKYFLISIDGGLEEALPIPEGGAYASFSPSGEEIAYTPISREFRNWKRYKGGRAQDIWIYDLKNNRSERITDFAGTDQHPIWYKDKIFFVSDRDLVLNIYSYDLKSKVINRITEHRDFDVLWPSGKNGKIVYISGGELYLLDLTDRTNRKVNVQINFDNPYLLPVYKNVKKNINSFEIAADGKRAFFEARGEIYAVSEKGCLEIENLTRTSGVREMVPAASPDGKYLAFYSDRSGEYELYLLELGDSKKIEQLTTGSKFWYFSTLWSPDSKKLLWADKEQRLTVFDRQTKKSEVISRSSLSDFQDYRWSPDGNWIVFTRDLPNGHSAIFLYGLREKREFQLTSGEFNDYSPVFSRDGRYLFFLSERTFNLQFSAFEFDYIYTRAIRIYALPLLPDLPPLLDEKSTEKNSPDKESKNEKQSLKIDFARAEKRVIALPPEAGDYRQLNAVQDGVIYLRESTLYLFSFKDKKEQRIADNIRGYVLNSAANKLLLNRQGDFALVDVAPNQEVEKNMLDLKNLELKIEPQKEWRQIFNDGWRIFRDWFYVKNMHGVDWEKIRQRYLPLVDALAHPVDLYLLFHEMLAEVNVGHAYVNWGDVGQVERIENGLLGCEFVPDSQNNLYRIGKIYQGENWESSSRSPLTEQGIMINEGDYVLELNYQRLTLKDNPYSALENCADKKIRITVNSRPDWKGARTYWVKPLKSELKLYYLDWVRSRREMVDRLSNGRIGYIHLPNTSIDGNRELFRGMYAFHDKEALIIDDRYNGGGFIPVVMIELLARKPLNYWARRGLELIRDPLVAHPGPKVMLINHYSSSGGDAIAYYFRKKNLGLLIGTRTWGGLVGISGNPRFVDGGFFNVPTFGFVNEQGEWDVEGVGVAPDIEVYDRPEEIVAGRDPSIERAVQELLKQLPKEPPQKIKRPADPDRSKWIEKKID